MERTPPPAIPPPPSLAPVSIEPSACNVCNCTMSEGQDCLIISECSHPFHRSCIENYLTTTSECPVCKRPCQLNELRSLLILQKTIAKPTNNKNKGRGAMAKHYNTRSTSRNIFQDPGNQFSLNSSMQGYNLQTPNRGAIGLNQNNINSPNQSTTNQAAANAIDYNEINRLIEANLTRLLQNINILPNSEQVRRSNAVQEQNANSFPVMNNITTTNITRPQTAPTNASSNLFNLSPNTFQNSNVTTMPSDKATSIIQSWNLKFDGSSSGLNVEEFLYRIRSLTNDNFNGDYAVICRNLNTLLTGKAKEWYWRYHKQTPCLNWNEFCEAIRGQYKDFKTSFDIREEIRNRKQKANESFDAFFEAVSAIMDRLPRPMTEEELIEILPRNLRPEVRQDLLYVRINSISHLRQLVQTREHFLNDEYVRKNLAMRHPGISQIPRRHVADIDIAVDLDISEDPVHNVDAFHKTVVNSQCWNCDETGHHWQDCLHDRTIFCYGCGAKNIYKPNCVECRARKHNLSKNLRPMGPQKD